MATKEGAEKACKEPNPIIDGRKANVNLAILGAKPRVNSLQGKNATLLSSILSYFYVWIMLPFLHILSYNFIIFVI